MSGRKRRKQKARERPSARLEPKRQQAGAAVTRDHNDTRVRAHTNSGTATAAAATAAARRLDSSRTAPPAQRQQKHARSKRKRQRSDSRSTHAAAQGITQAEQLVLQQHATARKQQVNAERDTNQEKSLLHHRIVAQGNSQQWQRPDWQQTQQLPKASKAKQQRNLKRFFKNSREFCLSTQHESKNSRRKCNSNSASEEDTNQEEVLPCTGS